MMKFNIAYFLVVLPALCQAELFLIDRAECVICGPAYNKPISNTDLTWKRTMDGQFVPLQKQLQNDIVVQQIATEKMPYDPAAAEKYVESIKKQSHLNDVQLEELFAQAGRTLAEGLDFLRNQYAIEFFMHYQFKSQLVPTDEEITAYYEEHPEFVDGYYEIQNAKVFWSEQDRDQVKHKLEQQIESNLLDQETPWQEPMKIASDDLPDEQKFLENMRDGEIVILEFDGFFELVKLIKKEPLKLQPLSECRSRIVDKLNHQKLETMLQNYNKSIKEFVDVIPLNKEIVADLA